MLAVQLVSTHPVLRMHLHKVNEKSLSVNSNVLIRDFKSFNFPLHPHCTHTHITHVGHLLLVEKDH